jgi:hypothetical protein
VGPDNDAENNSHDPALMVGLNSDNYIKLMPGKKKNFRLRLNYADTRGV